MLTSGVFNNLVTVQERDLDASQDAMDLDTTWVDAFTDFAMISQVARVQQMTQNYDQAWVNQGVYKFTFRGDYEFSVGGNRFLWEGRYYQPVNLTRHPGINRFESLTYVYCRLADTSSLTR